MTALGAAVVFFFKERINSNIQRIFLGFAAGVMIAASVWSLLIPAIEEAESAGQIGWIPAAGISAGDWFFNAAGLYSAPSASRCGGAGRAFQPLETDNPAGAGGNVAQYP